MVGLNLRTYAKPTWCPGCTNYAILSISEQAIKELIEEGFASKKDFVMTAGIGCHGKIFDYLGINGYYGLHGRALSLGIGIKLANPELKVITYAGDGDMLAEGLDHLIHASRDNPDVTLVLHNNQVFALTTGQHTPTTEPGYFSKSLGRPSFEKPLNPIALTLMAGATFVARVYSLDLKHFKEVLKKAIKHKGFSFVEVLQPCITFNDTRKYFQERIYHLEDEGHDPSDFNAALKKAMEWDYSLDPNRRVPVGIFYETERPTLEEQLGVKPWYKVQRSFDERIFEEVAVQ